MTAKCYRHIINIYLKLAFIAVAVLYFRSLTRRKTTYIDIRVVTEISGEFEDTKVVIRIHISKKNRQPNGQKKKYKKEKQGSTKHTHKTKDRVT